MGNFSCGEFFEKKSILRREYKLDRNPVEREWIFEYNGNPLTFPDGMSKHQILLYIEVTLLTEESVDFYLEVPMFKLKDLQTGGIYKKESDKIKKFIQHNKQYEEMKKRLKDGIEKYNFKLKPKEKVVLNFYKNIKKDFDNLPQFLSWCRLDTVFWNNSYFNLTEKYREIYNYNNGKELTREQLMIEINANKFNKIKYCNLKRILAKVSKSDDNFNVMISVNFINFEKSKLEKKIGYQELIHKSKMFKESNRMSKVVEKVEEEQEQEQDQEQEEKRDYYVFKNVYDQFYGSVEEKDYEFIENEQIRTLKEKIKKKEYKNCIIFCTMIKLNENLEKEFRKYFEETVVFDFQGDKKFKQTKLIKDNNIIIFPFNKKLDGEFEKFEKFYKKIKEGNEVIVIYYPDFTIVAKDNYDTILYDEKKFEEVFGNNELMIKLKDKNRFFQMGYALNTSHVKLIHDLKNKMFKK